MGRINGKASLAAAYGLAINIPFGQPDERFRHNRDRAVAPICDGLQGALRRPANGKASLAAAYGLAINIPFGQPDERFRHNRDRAVAPICDGLQGALRRPANGKASLAAAYGLARYLNRDPPHRATYRKQSLLRAGRTKHGKENRNRQPAARVDGCPKQRPPKGGALFLYGQKNSGAKAHFEGRKNASR